MVKNGIPIFKRGRPSSSNSGNTPHTEVDLTADNQDAAEVQQPQPVQPVLHAPAGDLGNFYAFQEVDQGGSVQLFEQQATSLLFRAVNPVATANTNQQQEHHISSNFPSKTAYAPFQGMLANADAAQAATQHTVSLLDERNIHSFNQQHQQAEVAQNGMSGPGMVPNFMDTNIGPLFKPLDAPGALPPHLDRHRTSSSGRTSEARASTDQQHQIAQLHLPLDNTMFTQPPLFATPQSAPTLQDPSHNNVPLLNQSSLLFKVQPTNTQQTTIPSQQLPPPPPLPLPGVTQQYQQQHLWQGQNVSNAPTFPQSSFLPPHMAHMSVADPRTTELDVIELNSEEDGPPPTSECVSLSPELLLLLYLPRNVMIKLLQMQAACSHLSACQQKNILDGAWVGISNGNGSFIVRPLPKSFWKQMPEGIVDNVETMTIHLKDTQVKVTDLADNDLSTLSPLQVCDLLSEMSHWWLSCGRSLPTRQSVLETCQRLQCALKHRDSDAFDQGGKAWLQQLAAVNYSAVVGNPPDPSLNQGVESLPGHDMQVLYEAAGRWLYKASGRHSASLRGKQENAYQLKQRHDKLSDSRPRSTSRLRHSSGEGRSRSRSRSRTPQRYPDSNHSRSRSPSRHRSRRRSPSTSRSRSPSRSRHRDKRRRSGSPGRYSGRSRPESNGRTPPSSTERQRSSSAHDRDWRARHSKDEPHSNGNSNGRNDGGLPKAAVQIGNEVEAQQRLNSVIFDDDGLDAPQQPTIPPSNPSSTPEQPQPAGPEPTMQSNDITISADVTISGGPGSNGSLSEQPSQANNLPFVPLSKQELNEYASVSSSDDQDDALLRLVHAKIVGRLQESYPAGLPIVDLETLKLLPGPLIHRFGSPHAVLACAASQHLFDIDNSSQVQLKPDFTSFIRRHIAAAAAAYHSQLPAMHPAGASTLAVPFPGPSQHGMAGMPMPAGGFPYGPGMTMPHHTHPGFPGPFAPPQPYFPPAMDMSAHQHAPLSMPQPSALSPPAAAMQPDKHNGQTPAVDGSSVPPKAAANMDSKHAPSTEPGLQPAAGKAQQTTLEGVAAMATKDECTGAQSIAGGDGKTNEPQTTAMNDPQAGRPSSAPGQVSAGKGTPPLKFVYEPGKRNPGQKSGKKDKDRPLIHHLRHLVRNLIFREGYAATERVIEDFCTYPHDFKIAEEIFFNENKDLMEWHQDPKNQNGRILRLTEAGIRYGMDLIEQTRQSRKNAMQPPGASTTATSVETTAMKLATSTAPGSDTKPTNGTAAGPNHTCKEEGKTQSSASAPTINGNHQQGVQPQSAQRAARDVKPVLISAPVIAIPGLLTDRTIPGLQPIPAGRLTAGKENQPTQTQAANVSKGVAPTPGNIPCINDWDKQPCQPPAMVVAPVHIEAPTGFSLLFDDGRVEPLTVQLLSSMTAIGPPVQTVVNPLPAAMQADHNQEAIQVKEQGLASGAEVRDALPVEVTQTTDAVACGCSCGYVGCDCPVTT